MPNPADAIIEQLLDRLPSSQSHIHIDELSATGVPDFIVARIERDIHRKIAAEFSLPDSVWTDTDNKRLQNAWQLLQNAALNEAWLPLSEAKRIFEPVVREAVNLLIRPRRMIPQVLFGSDSTLDREELEERTQSIFVHQQLVSAPLRYLSRKSLDSLSRSRCHQLIEKVDEQLCLRYNPAAWLGQLEPLLELSGGRVNPELPAIFFQDKNRPRMSRRILESSGPLTRSDLIELLSGPELLSRPLTEEDRPGLFGARPMEVKQDWRSLEESGSHEQSMGREHREGDERKKLEDLTPDTPALQGVDGVNHREDEVGRKSDGLTGVPSGRPDRLDRPDRQGQSERREQPVDQKRTGTNGDRSSHLRAFNTDSTPTPADEVPRDRDASGESWFSRNSDRAEETDTGHEDQVNLWERFLSGEDDEERREHDASDDGFSLASSFKKTESPGEELIAWLGEDAVRFRKRLFKGSGSAFDSAMSELAALGEWRIAVGYIEKDIFARYRVDMYEEIAVDFTDRMHEWFTDHKPSMRA